MNRNYAEWYEEHYQEMTGNGIWFKGGELNTLNISEYVNRTYRVLITRLSTYWDTADSFTHKLLYQIITRQSNIYADFAFLPPAVDASLFETYGIPWLIGTSSKKDASQFCMVAFSNSIVQELLNIPAFLVKSKIPLSKEARMSRDDLPLVILGGANALYTSSLCNDDPVVDGIFVGEDAELIKKIFSVACNCKVDRLSKLETLRELEAISGFFQPDKQGVTRKFTSAVIANEQLLNNAPVMYTEEQMGSGNLQISDGCPCFCSFCAESWGRKPYRELSLQEISSAAHSMKATMGLENIELYSFNFNMHREFSNILWNLSGLFSSIGLKSQRFDAIAAEPEIVKSLHAIGKSSITCGLEGISSRLRKYLHKSLDDQELRNSLSILIRAPIRELKIFLIATGKETEEDFSEFCCLLSIINNIISMAGRRPRIIFSMTPLVRFPYTPLECEDAPEPSVCREIVLQTERFVNSRGFEFRDSADTNDYHISQILVRTQNRNISNAVFSAVLQSGFVYYKEIPGSLLQLIETKLKKINLDSAAALKGLSSKSISNRRVIININDIFLKSQSDTAVSFTDNGFCLGTINYPGKCQSCGGCETPESVDNITSIRKPQVFKSEALKKRVKDKQEAITISFKVDVSSDRRGIPKKDLGIALARAIMLIDNRMVEPFLSYGKSYINNTFNTPWITGDDILTLNFHKSSEKLLDELFSENEIISQINLHLNSWGTVKEVNCKHIKPSVVLEIEAPFKFDGIIFFKQRNVKYITRKAGENHYTFDISKDSLKKKVVGSFAWNISEEGCFIRLQPLEKFNLEEFIENSFFLPSPKHRFRVKVISKIEM